MMRWIAAGQFFILGIWFLLHLNYYRKQLFLQKGVSLSKQKATSRPVEPSVCFISKPVLAPFDQTVFLSRANSRMNILFRWKRFPASCKIELFLKSANENFQPIQWDAGLAGLSLNLPDGVYYWKIKVSGAEKKPFESKIYSFSIQEQAPFQHDYLVLEQPLKADEKASD